MATWSFPEILERHPVLFDGGMGTMLYGRGVFINRCFDELNLSAPDLVRGIHEDYVLAGADVIETNTFGANAVKLEGHGFRDRLGEINRKGVQLARIAARGHVLVAGSMGPLGIKIEPWGPTSVDEARALFREQAEALLEGGVDLFVLETFSDINEIQQALRAIRDLAADVPVVAQMSLGEDGNSLYGTAPEVFTARLAEWRADVVGVNCSVGPAIMLDVLERMARVTRKPLAVMPNAGLPRNVDGRNIYLASPEYLASYARRFVAAGARVVGGCCGTTPDHIRAMRRALEAAAPGRSAPSPEPLRSPRPEQPEPAAAEPTRSRLAARLDKGQFVVAAELDPPRGLDVDDVLGGVRQLLQHGIDLVDVPVGSRARANMGSEALALLLEREAGVETLVHYTCRDRNLLGMQSDLIGAFALGLRNLVGETGDAALEGATVVTTKVYDIDSIGLTNMVHRLNQGLDVGGSSIGHSTGWHIGVRLNPTAVDPELEARRFAWKVDAGAHFCLTRPVFDVDALQRCLRRTEATPLKVLLTLWPLGSWREAEFLANEVPGLSIPAPLLERMRQAAGRSEEHERAEGVAIARELLTAARTLVQGVVVSTHGSRYQAAVEVVEAVDAP